MDQITHNLHPAKSLYHHAREHKIKKIEENKNLNKQVQIIKKLSKVGLTSIDVKDHDALLKNPSYEAYSGNLQTGKKNSSLSRTFGGDSTYNT